MGKSYSVHEPYLDEKENIFVVKPYVTDMDSVFKYYENDLNLLKYIDIYEFQQILYNFSSSESKADATNNEYDQLISKVFYQVFFDKKIINHFLVYPNIINNEKQLKTSTAFYNSMFDNIYKNYKFYNKKLSGNDSSPQKTQHDNIKKLCLLSLGFVYCWAKTNYHKVQFIVSLFSNEKREVENSPEFRIFLFFVLLFPSNIYLLTINDLGNEFEDLKIADEKFTKIYDAFEVKDSARMLDIIIDKLFGNNKSLKTDVFVSNLSKVDWLLSPAGIRKSLKENNDGEQ